MNFLQPSLLYLAGVAGFGVLLVCSCWISYTLATRVLSTFSSSMRLAATMVIQYWLLTVVFVLLVPFYGFRIGIVLAIVISGALAAYRWNGAKTLRWLAHDVRRGRELCTRAGKSRLLWFLLPAGMILFLRLIRSLVAPPLGWDALTYHFLKAGRWVQDGGFQPEKAPDAWGYYEYLPAGGDLLWAWAMLPFRGDAFLGVAGVLIWATCVLAAYAFARQFTLTRLNASWAALLVGYTPATMNYVASGYVDNTGLAYFLLACTLLAGAWKTREPVLSVLGIAALGLAAGTRVSFLPMLILTVPLVTLTLRQQVRKRAAYLAYFTACTVAATLPCFSYFYALVKTGNILYPIHVTFLGKLLFRGNEEFMLIHYGLKYQEPARVTFEAYANFIYKFLFSAPTYEHLNLTALAPLILLLGAFGCVAAGRFQARRYRLALIYSSGCAAWLIYLLLAPGTAYYRLIWAEVMGRFFTPGYSVFIITAYYLVHLFPVKVVLVAASVLSLICCVPLGMAEVDSKALMYLLISATPLLISAILVRYTPVRMRQSLWIKWIMVGGSLVFLGGIGYSRDALRYKFYKSVPRTYDVHRLVNNLAPSDLWEFLDRPGQPLRIAHTAAFSLNGHNWYRYPYMGRRLQNRIMYVPVTADGSVQDNMLISLDGRSASSVGYFPAWYRRLRALGINYVACSGPLSFEVRWMEARKDLFKRVLVDSRQLGIAYEVIGNSPGSTPAENKALLSGVSRTPK